MDNSPAPSALRGYPIDRDLLAARRAQRRARPRFAILRAVAARMRRGSQR